MKFSFIKYICLLSVLASCCTSQTCNSKAGVWSTLELADSAAPTGCYYLGVTTNPVSRCPTCTTTCANNLASKVIRVSGDWSMDVGSSKLWDGAEPKGLMTFDEQTCSYILVMTGLKPSFSYKWKVTVNNMWVENYGCGGTGDCLFKSSSAGAIRFIVKPTTGAPQLSTDLSIDPSIIPSTLTPPIGPTAGPTPNPITNPPQPIVNKNPTKPCTTASCPVCSNNLAAKVCSYLNIFWFIIK